MGRFLRRIGARTGISLGLILVIAAVVVVARIIDDQRTNPSLPRIPGVVEPTVAATEGDDGPVVETPGEYLDDEAVLAGATGFTTAWLNRTLPADQWLDGLRPHATEDLIGRLAGVDPLDVPSTAVLGTPSIRERSALYADVVAPVGSGDTLVLGLVKLDDHWLVATLDRETG